MNHILAIFKNIFFIFLFVLLSFNLFATSYYKATRELNVRTGPGVENKVLFLLKEGEETEVLEKTENWYKINYNSQTGYVSGKYLQFSREVNSENEEAGQPYWNMENKWLVAGVAGVAILFFIFILFIANKDSSQSSTGTVSEEVGQPTRIIVKSTKSVGIAIILVIVFGPLGMFYSTITGAIIMTLLAPIILVFLFFTGKIGSVFLLAILYYPICIIWTARSANSYNRRIL